MSRLPSLLANASLSTVVDAFEQADALTGQIIQHGGLVAASASGVDRRFATVRHSVGAVPVAYDYNKNNGHPLDIEIAVGCKDDVRHVIGGVLTSYEEHCLCAQVKEQLQKYQVLFKRYCEGVCPSVPSLREDLYFPMQGASLLKKKELMQAHYSLDLSCLQSAFLQEANEEVGEEAAASMSIGRKLSETPKETHLATATFGSADDAEILALLQCKGVTYDVSSKRLRGLIITIREDALKVTVPDLATWKNLVRPTKELDGVEVLRMGDLYERYVQATSGTTSDEQLRSWRSFKGGKPRPSTIWYPLQLLKGIQKYLEMIRGA